MNKHDTTTANKKDRDKHAQTETNRQMANKDKQEATGTNKDKMDVKCRQTQANK